MKVCNEIGFEGDGEVKAMRKKPIDIMAMQEDCWIIQGDLVDNPVHSKYQHVKHTHVPPVGTKGKVDHSLNFFCVFRLDVIY